MLGICAVASGQTQVKPALVSERPEALDSPATSPKLRCRLDEIVPELDFGLQFRTGFVVDLPMSQFEGWGHTLNSYVQVTPENSTPLYLQSTGDVPKVPEASVEGQIRGTFIVGEGSYDVDVVIEDDLHRICRAKWRAQAQYEGSLRRMIPARPAAMVESLKENPFITDVALLPGNSRFTIMIHAAPLKDAEAAKLPETDIEAIAGTLTALMRQLPMKSVRLVMFNMDLRSVLLREDEFSLEKIGKVTSTLKDLQTLVVDYRTLQQKPGDMISDLVQEELKNLQRSDTLILIGPSNFRYTKDDIPVTYALRSSPAMPSLFYLQYYLAVPAFRRGGEQLISRAVINAMPMGTFDNFEKFIGRLRGKTVPIHTPEELVNAIRLIQTRVAKN
jgi:hypothetical protein